MVFSTVILIHYPFGKVGPYLLGAEPSVTDYYTLHLLMIISQVSRSLSHGTQSWCNLIMRCTLIILSGNTPHGVFFQAYDAVLPHRLQSLMEAMMERPRIAAYVSERSPNPYSGSPAEKDVLALLGFRPLQIK